MLLRCKPSSSHSRNPCRPRLQPPVSAVRTRRIQPRVHPEGSTAACTGAAMSAKALELERYLLELQQQQLDSIGCGDFEAYADT